MEYWLLSSACTLHNNSVTWFNFRIYVFLSPFHFPLHCKVLFEALGRQILFLSHICFFFIFFLPLPICRTLPFLSATYRTTHKIAEISGGIRNELKYSDYIVLCVIVQWHYFLFFSLFYGSFACMNTQALKENEFTNTHPHILLIHHRNKNYMKIQSKRNKWT